MSARLGLEGRVGLVLGAGSEIGRACVKRLGDEGMTINSLIESDLRDRNRCDEAVQRALARSGGRIDVLVTTPGIVAGGSIEKTPESDFRAQLEANLTAPFRVGRACARSMRERGRGSIITVASDAGIRADHTAAGYSVTSAAVIALAELFAADGAADGVRCNAVCPAAAGGETANDGADGVAALVAWLACDESTHVNGATLRIDGGAGAAMVADTRG